MPRRFPARPALAALAAAAFAWTAATAAPPAARPATRPPHGDYWVNILDFGAVPDNGTTDNSGPIQAAIDNMAARLDAGSNPQAKGVVFIPSTRATFSVRKPVFVDHDNIEIRGEGWGSQIAAYGPYKNSVLVLGVRRRLPVSRGGKNILVAPDRSNRPDAFGRLDASAAPRKETRWGFRSKGDSFLQFTATPLSAGVRAKDAGAYSDNWSQTSALTVEFCAEAAGGGAFPPGAPLLGVGSFDPTEPAPFVMKVWDEPNKVLVAFRTSDQSPGETDTEYPARMFSFRLGPGRPFYRVAVQFDLAKARASAYVNGAQVAVKPERNMGAEGKSPFRPGTTFAVNDHFPFMVGASGMTGPNGGKTGVDMSVFGLRLSNTLRYQDAGPGRRQTRADNGAPPDDAFAYFGEDPHTVAFLPFTDHPGDSRLVTVKDGAAANEGTSTGLLLHAHPPMATSGLGVHDLYLSGAVGYGQVIGFGAVIEPRFSNLKVIGGYHAIGAIPTQVNYWVRLQDCILDGLDAGFAGVYSLVEGERIVFSQAGRATIRSLGGEGNWRDLMVTRSSPVSECLLKARAADYGGGYTLQHVMQDYEGESLSRAAFYVEAHAQAPATSLTLRDIYLGTVGKQASLVQLKDIAGPDNTSIHHARLSVENLQAWTGDYAAVVDVDGPRWHGEVKSVGLKGPRFLHRRKWGDRANVVIHESEMDAPPTSGSWYAGAHVIHPSTPRVGGYAEYRCVKSGTYGTDSPPVWAGVGKLEALP